MKILNIVLKTVILSMTVFVFMVSSAYSEGNAKPEKTEKVEKPERADKSEKHVEKAIEHTESGKIGQALKEYSKALDAQK